MTSNQEETTTTPAVTTTESAGALDNIKASFGNILSQPKIRLGLIVGLVIATLLAVALGLYYYQHTISVWGMNDWSKRSAAKPIECMIRDTNDDGYVSCSAILNDQVVPLECGASLFNIGCRVNYGAAAPAARRLNIK